MQGLNMQNGYGLELITDCHYRSGADPGFQKGGGTPKQSAENAKINDIHYPLN